MGKLTVTAFTTLDNVMERPDKWSFPYFNDAVGALNDSVIGEADSLLLGRVTYEGFAEAWPQRSGDAFADKINAMPKYAVSRTLGEGDAEWHNTTVLGDDAVARIRELRERENVLVWGSAGLVETLVDEGLVDEFVLVTSPVVLGEGKKLLPAGAMEKQRVASVESLDGGMFALRLVAADG